MKLDYKSDHPITEAACKEATGKTLKEWFAELDKLGDTKRRDAINWLYAEMGKDMWWCTTAWVEYERAKGVVQKDGLSEGYNICVTKTIAAPVEDVYKAWTEPKQLEDWFCGGFKGSMEEGGSFDDCDGNHADVLRVRENKDLRFDWKSREAEHVTRVDMMLADKGKGKTGITLNHNRIQTREEADSLRRAWGEAFDKLKKKIEA